jgi:hypothetical protein
MQWVVQNHATKMGITQLPWLPKLLMTADSLPLID